MNKIILRDYCTFDQITEAYPGSFPWSEGALIHLGYRKQLSFVRVPLWRKTDLCRFLLRNREGRHSPEFVRGFAKAIGLEESTQAARKRR